MLAQTRANIELIVIDDASTDGVADIVREYQWNHGNIVLLQNETNLRLTRTLNRGIQEAHGKYIARIDDDDIWCDPEKLAKQVERLESDTNLVLIGTNTTMIDASGQEIGHIQAYESDRDIRSRILRFNPFSHSSVVIRKSALDTVGEYNPEWNYTEDYELWLRLGRMGTLANLPDTCLRYRVLPTSVTRQKNLRQRWMSLALSWQYRRDYPGFLSGFLVRTIIAILPEHTLPFARRVYQHIFK